MFGKVGGAMDAMIKKVRPTIVIAMGLIFLLALGSATLGWRMDAPEVAASAVGSGLALIGALGMKVLEKD